MSVLFFKNILLIHVNTSYLNEEEYNILEHSISEINQWMLDIGIPTHKKMYSIMSMQYLTNHDNLQNGDMHVPNESVLQQKYLSKTYAFLNKNKPFHVHIINQPITFLPISLCHNYVVTIHVHVVHSVLG